MDFALSGPQMKLRDEVRRFAEEEVAPQVPSLDEKGEFPLALVKRLAQLGLIVLFFPREYGGRGLGFLGATLAREEVSLVYPPLGFFYEGNDAGLYMLYSAGSEEQKRKYLPPICRGEKLTCFALTEASGGSDPSGLQTTAEAGGDGFVINGRKVFITLGEVADYCVFVARAGDRFNAFVVEKGAPGFEVGPRAKIAGLRGIPVSELAFTNLRLPRSSLLGVEGTGLQAALGTITLIARPGIAAIALGLARGALEATIKFVKERTLRAGPVASFPAVQFMLADMEMEVEAARWLCYHASWLVDQGKTSREVAQDAARAKLYATEAAVRVCLKGIQLMGGYGATLDCPLTRRLADALALLPAAGTSEVMRLTIGRELTR